MQCVLAERIISISELAKNVGAAMRDTQAGPIAVLDNDRITAYLVSADLYEAMLERLDDFDLAILIRARSQEIAEPISLDDL
ncbi:Phd-YefM [Pseudomonas sp. GM50]|jgi:antitoxin StbD|uniref:type II toxin-antitoxin system Phd/YefM family antitoxin n=1 Tax=Pseudomonas sp. GM50 TaxID=1144332 RepID=UPI00027080C3|nr:type II toxin-antitoxin system Phd/YefM family antitoxin [Pseudomonas sp. GM50]EJM66431.1 Phd-YefM [Pseudomonas sp. GM50]